MPVTDEDVAQRQDEILALRAERDQAKIDAETAFKARDNEITMALLDIEEQHLQAELDQYQAQVSTVDAAVEAQIEAVQGETASELEPEHGTAIDLDSMTKAQLQDYANSVSVTLTSSMSRDEMLAAIRAGKE